MRASGLLLSKILLAFGALFNSQICEAQKSHPGIEINPFVRKDSYKWFRYKELADGSDSISLKGISWGLSLSYRFSFGNGIYLKAGLGYFRYRFNKVIEIHPLFGPQNGRMINYPSPNYVVFRTDRYSYNTFLINTGIEKQVDLNEKLNVTIGLTANSYFTFSQSYHISVGPPLGPENGRYQRKDFGYFGTSAFLEVSLRKKIGKIEVGPNIIIPVVNVFKQDEVFPGDVTGGNRSKTGRGFGIGVKIIIPVGVGK